MQWVVTSPEDVAVLEEVNKAPRIARSELSQLVL
jgi:hypothetical protein